MNGIAGDRWKILLWFVSGLATICLFYDVLLHPGTTLLSIDGDASKNYFTFAYHSLYGSGIWFDGMNYPYGEHIVFTDAQPAIVIPLSLLNNYLYLPPLAVMNVLLVLGFFLAIIYTSRVLMRFGVHPVWSVVAAVLIVVMSPQQFKLAEHFSLAYFCVLPIVFYYHLAWYQSGKRQFVFKLFLATLLFTFIHLYYALMICLWVALYSIGHMLMRKTNLRKKLLHIVPLFVAAIVPVILFQLFMLFTDSIIDRPAYPYGARAHGTNFNDIFTSYLSPFSLWLSKLFDTGTLSGGNEGYAYIGMAPLLILLTALVYWIANISRRQKVDAISNEYTSLNIWLFIAISILVFASAVIFKKCFVCLDYASFIKQFRAIGRFSWPYYYLVTVVTVVIAYRWYIRLLQQGKQWAAYLLAGSLLVAWTAEAIPFAHMTRKRVADADAQYNLFYKTDARQWEQFLSQAGYTKDEFRALYALPYFHIGTEKLGLVTYSYGQVNDAFSASLQLHLPLMNVMMSRTSWQQAFEQVKVSGGPYTDKQVLRSDDSRPILIIHPAKAPLNPDELYLLSSAKKLGHLNGNDIYALSTEELLKKEAARNSELKTVFDAIPTQDTCINYTGPWYVEHYDTGTAAEALMGRGAAKPIEGITQVVFEAPLTPVQDSQLYEFSTWMLVSDKDYKIGRFVVYMYNENDSLLTNFKVLAQESVDNHGLWLRVSKYFRVPASCRKLSVELINIIYPSYLALDELMIRPADAVILSKSTDTGRMVNNHMFLH